MSFSGGLVKPKSAFVLSFFDLFGEPAFLLEDARAKDGLAAANEERNNEFKNWCDEFHGWMVVCVAYYVKKKMAAGYELAS